MQTAAQKDVSFGEAFRFWLKLGFISFGRPAGQIATMQRELVDNKKWIEQDDFLHALNYCMILPGPEAQQARHIYRLAASRHQGRHRRRRIFCHSVNLFSANSFIHLRGLRKSAPSERDF